MPKRFHSLGIPGRVLLKFDHGESLKKFIMVDVGFEPTTQKTHGLSTTPVVKVFCKNISRTSARY